MEKTDQLDIRSILKDKLYAPFTNNTWTRIESDWWLSADFSESLIEAQSSFKHDTPDDLTS